jgi:hypothetical protein
MPKNININTVKHSCDGTTRYWLYFSVAGRFPYNWVVEFWILRTPDTGECKGFFLEICYRYFHVSFQTGFTVYINSERRKTERQKI